MHEGGVTWLSKINDNYIYSGSHDSTMRLWDERMIKNEISKVNFGGSNVWDV